MNVEIAYNNLLYKYMSVDKTDLGVYLNTIEFYMIKIDNAIKIDDGKRHQREKRKGDSKYKEERESLAKMNKIYNAQDSVIDLFNEYTTIKFEARHTAVKEHQIYLGYCLILLIKKI